MSGKTYLGNFVRVQACTVCDWVRNPINHHALSPPALGVCPKCGSDLDTVVGQFEFEEKKKWFSTESVIVGFVKKET